MGRAGAAAFAVLLFSCGQGGAGNPPPPVTIPPRTDWPPPRTYQNPIPAENALTGEPNWNRGFNQPWAHQIEGFADRVSAEAGDVVTVRANAAGAGSMPGNWTLYRIGWYGGAGARAVAQGTATFETQPACAEDTTTGLVHCENWSPTFTVAVPKGAVSGLYLIRMVRADGFGSFVPLVVRDARAADLLFQSSVTTFQAYNDFAGESLYTDADDGIAGHMAVQVSFDRPYHSGNGAGNLLDWEAHFARFVERYGYDVSYTTNLDVVREGLASLRSRGAFMSVGHDEYWPGEERDIVEAARDSGMPLLFFGANPAYWKVRLSNPGADGNARIITCYKVHPELDPLANTPQRTGRYRDAAINRPEEELVGVMYESWMYFGHPWVVSDASSPLLAGTGLSNGDTIPMLVGYEYDRSFGVAPPPGTLSVIARSPVVDAESRPGFSETAIYVAPNGASVFGAGSIYWSLGLEGPQADARIQRITANVFHAALKLPIPDGLATIAAPPPASVRGTWASNVATVARGLDGPAGVDALPDGSVLVADPHVHQILRVVNGSAQPFAGDGNPDVNPHSDNVPALQARFYQPTSVAVAADGRVFVADTHANAIRVIGTDANRTVTTFAGARGVPGYADGIGSAARFQHPMSLAWLDATHLLVADCANNAIRKIDTQSGAVTTVAITHGGTDADGTTSTASFYNPTAVTAGPDGRIYFVASQTGKLKAIGTDGSVVSLTQGGFGLADGPGTTAKLLPQGGLVWDGSALLVSDPGNQRVRRVVPGKDAASTMVTTFAGSGAVGISDGSASAASFATPLGMHRTADGRILIVDGGGALRVLQH